MILIKKAFKKLSSFLKKIPVLSAGLKFLKQKFPLLDDFFEKLYTADNSVQNSPGTLINYTNDEDHFYRLIIRQTEKITPSGNDQ